MVSVDGVQLGYDRGCFQGLPPADNLPFIAVAGVAVVTALFSAAALPAALEVGAAL